MAVKSSSPGRIVLTIVDATTRSPIVGQPCCLIQVDRRVFDSDERGQVVFDDVRPGSHFPAALGTNDYEAEAIPAEVGAGEVVELTFCLNARPIEDPPRAGRGRR